MRFGWASWIAWYRPQEPLSHHVRREAGGISRNKPHTHTRHTASPGLCVCVCVCVCVWRGTTGRVVVGMLLFYVSHLSSNYDGTVGFTTVVDRQEWAFCASDYLAEC